MSRVVRQSLSAIVIGLLAVGCGGAAPAKEVNATLKTFGISLSSTTAKAGEVTFHVKNTATDLPHEFVVVRTDLASDKLPLNSDGNVNEEDSELNHVDELENIQTGSGGDLRVTLTPGHYIVMCNVPGHYKGGMHADLTVVP